MFRWKTEDGTVVLENLPADAEVVVDGRAVTVSRGGEQATVRLAKGGPHRLKVLLGGREVYADDLSVDQPPHSRMDVQWQPPGG